MADELVYGLHAVLAALKRSPARVGAVWLSAGRGDARAAEIERQARSASVPVHRVAREELEALAEGVLRRGAPRRGKKRRRR